MATDPDLKREIAEERRELTNAVADLRDELKHTAARGRQGGGKATPPPRAAPRRRRRRRAGDPDCAEDPAPLPGLVGQARRTAPKRAASASTIDARTGATSS